MNIRRLTDNDWDTLVSWWDNWPKWKAPVKDFLPENGKGGLIVEINYKYLFAVMQHKGLIETHEKLGWKADPKPSYELTKVL